MPKYHVGDTLYRKDTNKKALIEQIVLFKHNYYPDVRLCYVVNEPLNLGSVLWSDVYLVVDQIDNDSNFCDFKLSGLPKYKAGDKLECSCNGRVVQIDLVMANSVSGGHPWKYHVTPWLFHPKEDGYHYCDHIDGNGFIKKTDIEITNSPKYKSGDVLVYTDEEFHSIQYALIEEYDTSSKIYKLSNYIPPYKRSMQGSKNLPQMYVDNSDNIRKANDKEVYYFLNNIHDSGFKVGEYAWSDREGSAYRIISKCILADDDGKYGIYYSMSEVFGRNHKKSLYEYVDDSHFKWDKNRQKAYMSNVRKCYNLPNQKCFKSLDDTYHYVKTTEGEQFRELQILLRKWAEKHGYWNPSQEVFIGDCK